MPTKIRVDDELVDAAMSLGHHGSRIEAATVALELYIKRLQQRKTCEASSLIDSEKQDVGN